MSRAVSTNPELRVRGDFRDEVSRRRPTFRVGNEIRLADGQIWVLPARAENSDLRSASFGAGYADLIHAILEAEAEPERRVAELAFIIFLLEHNYYLSPADYQRLLESKTRSGGSSDWEAAFRGITDQRVVDFLGEKARASV
jgi:hypothetical protein